MKRALKTLLCGLLASLLLAGCTQSGGGTSSTGGSGESSTSNSSATSGDVAYDENGVSPEGTYPIVEEPITLTVMFPSQTAIPDIAENSFTKEYEELTGIISNGKKSPLTACRPVSTSPCLAAICLTSICPAVSAFPSSRPMVRRGHFVPLNDYIEQYGDVFQKIEENVPGVADTLTMGDGNIYATALHEKCVHCEGSSKLWINTKWLDALDMEPPTTVDEFEDMLRRFKEEDPKGQKAR